MEKKNTRDHPLTVYVFSSNSALKKKGVLVSLDIVNDDDHPSKVTDNTQSGSVVMNDTLLHVVGSSKSLIVSKKIKLIHVSLIQPTVCHLEALALVDVCLS